MNKYGYTTDRNNLPSDNVWKSGNEITLNDDSIVYGYEGTTESATGMTILSKDNFIAWLDANKKVIDGDFI